MGLYRYKRPVHRAKKGRLRVAVEKDLLTGLVYRRLSTAGGARTQGCQKTCGQSKVASVVLLRLQRWPSTLETDQES